MASTKDPRAVLLEKMKKMNVTISHGGANIPRADTGSKQMNKVLGGGYPIGHITELFGKPGTGKSTMAIYAMRQALLRGKRVFYFKGERRVDFSYWAKLGMPMELNPITGEWNCTLHDEHGPMVDVIAVDTAEQAIQSWQWMLESSLYGVGVFDGITSIPPKGEVETDFTKDTRVGGVSKLLSRAMRVMGPIIENSGCAVIIINQIRDAIGDQWNPITTPGGWSLKHAGSLRIQMYDPKEEWVDAKTRDQLKNIIFRYYIRKTSVSDFVAGLQQVVMSRNLETGALEIDPVQETFTVGKEIGLFEGKDSAVWNGKGNCYFDSQLLGNGEANILAAMRADMALFTRMEAKLEGLLASGVSVYSRDEPVDDE